MNETFTFNKKTIFLALIFTLVVTLHQSLISATVIGVSPANLTFLNVMRGGYAQNNLIVSSDSQDPTNVTVSSTGNISSWLNFSKIITLTPNSPYTLTFSVNPPNDIPNGNYTGFLILETAPSGGGIAEHAVGIIRSTLDVYITVQVTDVQVVQCQASHYSVQSVEKGDDTDFVVNVTNTGNVLLAPRVTVTIWNQDQSQILKTLNFVGSQILPTTQKRLDVSFNTGGLDTAQYWAEVSTPDCLGSELLTFDVLEPGAIKADGILLDIFTVPQAEVGDTVPIEAHFKNTGEKDVGAQFEGQITKSGKVIQLLNSPLSDVSTGQTGTFTFYFTPQSSGDYIISGKVYYSGKVSYEQSATLHVVSQSAFSYLLPIVYFLLVVLIAFLFVKIIREKKNYRSVLRRLKK
jgi:hypothetical protein